MTRSLFFPATPDGIDEAIEASDMPPVRARQLIEKLKEKERRVIRGEYSQLRRRGVKKDEALRILSEKHGRSEGSIDHIVYPRAL